MILESIFWFFVFIVAYVYAGYPIILRITARKDRAVKRADITPSVTLFIPAYNEATVIREKIENSISLDYPRHNLEIVVASDCSSDDTGQIAKGFLNKGVILFEAPQRGGKNSLINEYITGCNGEIIVFTDANSFFDANAIRKLVRNFSDEAIGCVVGNLRYVDEKTSVGKGEGLYFRYESMIKELESRHGAVVTANGAIYAIRKSLFKPIALDVPNDFAHPIQISSTGYKIIFEKEAMAYEKATLSSAEEYRRRVRIVNRSFAAFMRYRKSYNMLRGVWGFCFISHKLLRWFIPFFLLALLLITPFLDSPFYRFILYGQLTFYAFAFAGVYLRGNFGKIFTVPFYFCLINLAALTGIMKYLAGERRSVWEAAKSTR